MLFLKKQPLALIFLLLLLMGFQKTRAADLSPIEKKIWPILNYYEQFKDEPDTWDRIAEARGIKNLDADGMNTLLEEYANALLELDAIRQEQKTEKPFIEDYKKFRGILSSSQQTVGDRYFLNNESISTMLRESRYAKRDIQRLVASIEKYKEKIKAQRGFLEFATDPDTKRYFSAIERLIIQKRVDYTARTGLLITAAQLGQDKDIIRLTHKTEQPVNAEVIDKIWRRFLRVVEDLPMTILHEQELTARINADAALTLKERELLKQALLIQDGIRHNDITEIRRISKELGTNTQAAEYLVGRYPEYDYAGIARDMLKYPYYFNESAFFSKTINQPKNYNYALLQTLKDHMGLKRRIAHDKAVYDTFQKYWYNIPLETRRILKLKYNPEGFIQRDAREIASIITGENTEKISREVLHKIAARINYAQIIIETKIKAGILPALPQRSGNTTVKNPFDVFGDIENNSQSKTPTGFQIKGANRTPLPLNRGR